MITDTLENIALYSNLSSSAIDFIKNLDKNIKVGKYLIDENTYANVEEYTTKKIDNCRFEAHREYLDIQILLNGSENIYYTSLNGLITDKAYDASRDIEFFADKIEKENKICLNGTNFMVIYPHEAHAPQVAVNEMCQKVKKVVVKVRV